MEETPSRAFPASAGMAGAGILISFLIKDFVSPLLVISASQAT